MMVMLMMLVLDRLSRLLYTLSMPVIGCVEYNKKNIPFVTRKPPNPHSMFQFRRPHSLQFPRFLNAACPNKSHVMKLFW
jgi:hypothetical protein